ncbi:hypothetical protein CVT25_014482 [Psilocybe cyanescens]|uniref:Uncharacterized protein n=1 Tax=Psilocybe cyanescens TaxID=93625 RepID=A0A409XRB4_PSICY|nr:hypothetical protein CVT25_014482 [Psilocybe cyanescens]
MEHQIPVFFPWVSLAEKAISQNPSLCYLAPPQDMLKEALDKVFLEQSIPLAGLVLHCYHWFHNRFANTTEKKILNLGDAPDLVSRYIIKRHNTEGVDVSESIRAEAICDTSKELADIIVHFDSEHCDAALVLACLPLQTMIESREDKGHLYQTWNSFFKNREKWQAELLRVENDKSCQACKQQEMNPPTKKTLMYTWCKITSSGGAVVYMHISITKGNFENMHTACPPCHQVYNAISNEWDLCTAFLPPSHLVGCDEEDDEVDYYDSDSEDECAYPQVNNCAPSPMHESAPSAPAPAPMPSMDIPEAPTQVAEATAMYQYIALPADDQQRGIESEDSLALGDEVQWVLQDVMNNLQFCYGFVLPFRDLDTSAGQYNACTWGATMQVFGFLENGAECKVSGRERITINAFHMALVGNTEIPQDLYNLNNKNFLTLIHLQDFRKVHRVSETLVVFAEPRSQACAWLLSVEPSEVILYVCCVLVSNLTHTIVTLAYCLLSKVVPFHTFIQRDLGCNAKTVVHTYNKMYNHHFNYMFSPLEFETYMLHCCQFFTQAPHGHAALLMGGIVAWIAKEYISADQALQGPSFEVTHHRAGFVVPTRTEG